MDLFLKNKNINFKVRVDVVADVTCVLACHYVAICEGAMLCDK